MNVKNHNDWFSNVKQTFKLCFPGIKPGFLYWYNQYTARLHLLFCWGIWLSSTLETSSISFSYYSFYLCYKATFFSYCPEKFWILELFLYLMMFNSPVKPSVWGISLCGFRRGRAEIILISFQESFFPLPPGPGMADYNEVYKTHVFWKIAFL